MKRRNIKNLATLRLYWLNRLKKTDYPTKSEVRLFNRDIKTYYYNQETYKAKFSNT